PGGGPSELKPLTSTSYIHNMLNQLNAVTEYDGSANMILIHKKIASYDWIPPTSRRMKDEMKFLFESNKFFSATTIFDEDLKELKFIYIVTYKDIKRGVDRINKVIELVDSICDSLCISIEEIFSKENGRFVTDFINKSKKIEKFSIWSKTSVLKFLSSTEHLFGRFEMQDKMVNLNGESSQTIYFSSVESKNTAIKVLEKRSVHVNYISSNSIDVRGKFFGELNGMVSFDKGSIITTPSTKFNDKETKYKMVDMMKEKYKLLEENILDVKIGVIDGGIPNDSFIKEQLYEYHNSTSQNFGNTNPTGNHAEQVCSLLLHADKLSEITNDKLKTPKVVLYDVMDDNEYIDTFKNKIDSIVRSRIDIKIWNISMSIEGYKNSKMISGIGIFLDNLQSELDIIFILPTGNGNEKESDGIIHSPSDSFFGLSIGSSNINNKPTKYQLNGYSFVFPTKPDLSIQGGDEGTEIIVISDNIPRKVTGTSFSAPLVARKIAYLTSLSLTTREAVTLLTAYSSYYSNKNNIEPSTKLGNGVLPIDSNELVNMAENKAAIVISLNIGKEYSQGFFDLKLPKYLDKYDFSYHMTYDCEAKTAHNPTYDYITDSARVVFGKVNPFNENSIIKFTDKINKEIIEEGNEDSIEIALRQHKGKYKNRATFYKRLKRNIKSTITLKGETKEIERWGFKIVRNEINGSRKEDMKISITIIFESENINTFKKDLIQWNKQHIDNINELDMENEIELPINYISFE
ncbi:MAG: S8 family serine peptidase, partial [Mycoplasmataceae bacterium]|nr:S8 family serine peptidase [Mycoplasmataceae bacterium]